MEVSYKWMKTKDKVHPKSNDNVFHIILQCINIVLFLVWQ